ncbi:hypothetical protein [Candidatus Ruminimicrobiellum ovillum]|jgi:hypothetical protein|uniref:hypothetical protein n=1 Tax=Candidatus Ruminimicrobiellum ovillum TaxID=1947927 RepID=UPI0035595C5A
MIYSIILFVILFVVIWVMHKPFDVHNTKLKRFHEWLEIALVVQGLIIVNYFLFGI